jgi:thiaminase (transcriptional activator TenA)
MTTTTSTPTTNDLWERASSIITATERHPFLVAMVDGTLTMKQFQYYVLQDTLYLHDFADCLRLLSRDRNANHTDSQRLEAFAKGAEEAEMSLHHTFCREWNIDVSKLSDGDGDGNGLQQMPNTLLYTSYMKQIVATRSYAEGLAVLLPCFWVYGHVGEQMLQLRAELGDRYAFLCCLV